jgi:RHS repeat-associated protein
MPARAQDAVKNQGTTPVQIDNFVQGPTIAPGATQQVSFTEVGNGTSCAQLGIATVNVGDPFDILAFAPAITPAGGSNLIPAGNQSFSGWTAFNGASVTLTQGQTALTYDSMDYLPFGEQIAGGSGTSHKFTEDERDSESNLDHTLFRQYSSSLGRWMTPDPAGVSAVDPTNPQSWNRYAYVLNNPLAYIDPFGLNDCPDDKSTCGDDPGTDTGAPGVDLFGGSPTGGDLSDLINLMDNPAATISVTVVAFLTDSISLGDMLNGSWGPNGPLHSGGNSSWAWTFTKTFVNGVLHGDRQPGQSFGACMDQNIKDTTFGTVDPKALTNKALVTAESTMAVLGSIPVQTYVTSSGAVGTLNGISAGAIGVTRTLGLGLGGSRAVIGALTGAGDALAVAGAATFGLVVGSAINCR